MRSNPLIVMSAVNLVEGGTLSVAKEMFAAADMRSDIHVIGLVNSKTLFPAYRRVRLIEFPKSKMSWLCRLYFEIVTSLALSQRLKPNVWFALHDITPRVKADRQYVYCHNPTPFYRACWRDLIFQPTVFLFSIFYRYLYRFNIRANKAVFVQQNHIRNFFIDQFPVDQVVVARPSSIADTGSRALHDNADNRSNKPVANVQLFYPTLPRSFKNIELLIAAAQELRQRKFYNFTIVITISAKDSLYARYLSYRARDLPSIRLVGRLSRDEVEQYYRQCDALVFPSKLETWGLPLTEAKSHGLPILTANLSYAKETLGCYRLVSFFDPDNAQQLADLIFQLANRRLEFQGSDFTLSDDVPVLNGWDQLVDFVVREKS